MILPLTHHPYPLRQAAFLSVLFVLLLPHSFAAVISVPGNYATIQAAIDASSDGDEIIVSPGTYVENINFLGKDVILRSTDPASPTVVDATIINGSQAGSVVTFAGTESASCVLSGFTITNGRTQWGAGICGMGTWATIEHNRIVANDAIQGPNLCDGSGGGLSHCNGFIFDNTISNNTAHWSGGGIYGGVATVQSNIITNNHAGQDGGGIYWCNGTIQNNLVSENSAGNMGGALESCSSTVQYNFITSNTALGVGGALSHCDGIVRWNTIRHNQSDEGGGAFAYCRGVTIKYNYICDNSTTGYWSTGGGLFYCDGVIENNTICGNVCDTNGGGMYFCEGSLVNNTIAANIATNGRGGGLFWCGSFIANCIIFGNTAAQEGAQILFSSTPFYCCIQDWTGDGVGNISSDPLFVDPANGDYHLQPSSPCIDAGHFGYCFPAAYIADIDAEARITGPSVDIGSDECLSAFDLDGDFLSDADEIALGTDPSQRDTDADGLLDGAEPLRGTDPTVANGPNGISIIPDHFPTIQHGIFLAFPNETITVSPGIYNEAIYFLGKNLVLTSTNPHDVATRASTVIDANRSRAAVTFVGTENTDSCLRGFTICGGLAQSSGGGIVGNGTLATIEYNAITTNACEQSYGAGITSCNGLIQFNTITNNERFALYDCNGTVRNNTISATNLYPGIAVSHCDGTIADNLISDNLGCGIVYGDGASIVNNIIISNAHSGIAGCDNSTIRNNFIAGNAISGIGGCAHSRIIGNTIAGNSTPYEGGGICGGSGVAENNLIIGNVAWRGGGLYCDGLDSLTIRNCIIAGNVAQESGGGLYVPERAAAIVQNCTITQNRASSGGGAYYYYCTPTPVPSPTIPPFPGFASSCQPPEESLSSSPAFEAASPGNNEKHLLDSSPPVFQGFKNCIIWSNVNANIEHECPSWPPPVSYCCIGGGWAGTGNIDSDPQFMRLGRWTGTPGQSDWIQGDYRLRDDSPCIDAGAYIAGITSDYEGDPRPFDGTSTPRGDGSDFDIGADEYIGAVNFDFASSQEHWTSGTAAVFSSPQWAVQNGALKIIALDNTNTFGSWTSPNGAIPATQGYLYRARFTVSTNVVRTPMIPQLRLRANSTDFQQADYLTITSAGDAGASPALTGTTYDLYFVPAPTTSSCILSFDLLNFDPSDASYGELALDSVLVERFFFNSISAPTLVRAYDFATSEESWSASASMAPFTSPIFSYADAALRLQSTDNTNTFGCWYSPAADVIVQPNSLYRVTADVRTDVTDPALVPDLRLRLNTENLQASRALHILSTADGTLSPRTANTTYDKLYFLPPPNSVGEGLIISFDLLNFLGDAPTGSLILDRATIEALSPPSSP